MKINKKSMLSNLKKDLKAAEPFKQEQDSKRAQWIKEFNGEPYGNERKGKSSAVSKDIKKQSLWQQAKLIDPFVSSPRMVKCTPVTYEDTAAAEQAEALLNYQHCRDFDRHTFYSNIVKVLQREGTVVVRSSWESKSNTIEVEVPDFAVLPDGQRIQYGSHIEEQEVFEYNRPTANVCKNNDIFRDPTAEDNIANAKFVIYRFKSNLSDLREDGRYTDLDSIHIDDEDKDYDDYYTASTDDTFRFDDKARKQLDVYEYWGFYDMNGDGIAEPIVATWVGNTLIQLQENPYPDRAIPFVSANIDAEPFAIEGKPNADLISVDQKLKTGIQRAIIDNMDSSTNGQKGIKKSSLDLMNKKRFLSGQNYEFDGSPNDMVEGSFNPIPNSVFDFYGVVSANIESLTGVKSFETAGSLGNTATAARGALNATAMRELDIVRTITEGVVKPLLRKWMAYNSEFLSDQEVVRVTNENFVTINRDDLDGNIDIDISVSTAETDNAKAQELAFMLQTMGQTLPFDITKMLMSNILELKGLPAAAKQLEEYQPQPDPIAQQKAQLELALLQAQVNNETAKAQENAVDVSLKQAKTQNELAKARGTNANADMTDLNFIEKQSGQDHDKALELENSKTRGKLLLGEQKSSTELNKALIAQNNSTQ